MYLKAVFLALVVGPGIRLLVGGGIVGRINEGVIVCIERFPWMAEIILNGTPSCGGSILNERTILTAAHCINDFAVTYQVRVGSNIKYKGGQLIDAKELLLHPRYHNLWGRNDIALIRLENDIVFSEYMAPIGLPKFEEQVSDGTVGYVTAWGQTEDGTNPYLRFTYVEVLPQKDCRNLFKDYFYNSRMMCAMNLKNVVPTLKGDSGSPLVVNKVVFGIVSWTRHNASLTGFRAAIFTRVPLFVPWIERTMKKWKTN